MRDRRGEAKLYNLKKKIKKEGMICISLISEVNNLI